MKEKHATGQVHIGGMTFNVTDIELSDGRADLSIVSAEGVSMSVPIPPDPEDDGPELGFLVPVSSRQAGEFPIEIKVSTDRLDAALRRARRQRDRILKRLGRRRKP